MAYGNCHLYNEVVFSFVKKKKKKKTGNIAYIYVYIYKNMLCYQLFFFFGGILILF